MSKNKAKIGVLLVNLGTPDSTKTGDVRKYLREFLMDGRVIDFPFIPRWMLVNLIIAPFRAPKSAGEYRKLWWLLIAGIALSPEFIIQIQPVQACGVNLRINPGISKQSLAELWIKIL